MSKRRTGNPTRRRNIISSVRFRKILPVILLSLAVAGCDPMDMNAKYVNPPRSERGLVIILPGIEGEGSANQNIRKGLDEGGIPYSLAIYRWGFPIPGIGLIVNQTDVSGNRRAAAELAKRLVEYQTKHPGKPVFIIGHSGGGGIAVFALEALGKIPAAKPIDGVFLLSASVSANYSLDRALRMTRRGLVNVANPDDKAMLETGTAIMGNMDGGHGASAGRTGFNRRHPNVYERKVTAARLGTIGDPHFIATNAKFIARYAPAWILSETWPPPTTTP